MPQRNEQDSKLDLKFAIVHDRFAAAYTGSEKVVESMLDAYPSPIYTLIADENVLHGTALENADIRTSFIQKMPLGIKAYQLYLPLFPLAIEQVDLSKYDVVISSSHTVAKGILTSPDQLHICYCHTPMRYIWDLYYDYLRDSKLERGLKSKIVRLIFHYLRLWDTSTASRVDYFIANSMHVARRIKKIYGRDSVVIYPPVDVDLFSFSPNKDNFYLAASRLVQYKKMDLIVDAFSRMPQTKLIVIGDGPDMKKIKARASRNIEILGYQPSDVLQDYMRRAKAFVFAANEDFGIIPVEAQACGTPVIAFRKGGVRETVVEGETGIFFDEQTLESLQVAVNRFERDQASFDHLKIRRNAERFSKRRFTTELKQFVDEKIDGCFLRGSRMGSSHDFQAD